MGVASYCFLFILFLIGFKECVLTPKYLRRGHVLVTPSVSGVLKGSLPQSCSGLDDLELWGWNWVDKSLTQDPESKTAKEETWLYIELGFLYVDVWKIIV